MKMFRFLCRSDPISIVRKDSVYFQVARMGLEYMHPSTSAIIRTKYKIVLDASCFRVNSTSVCKGIKDMISEMFGIDGFRVGSKGLSMVWTINLQEIERYLCDCIAVKKGTPREFWKLLQTISWAKDMSINAQRRIRYDHSKRRCVLPKRGSSGNTLLYSPLPRERSCWGGVDVSGYSIDAKRG